MDRCSGRRTAVPFSVAMLTLAAILQPVDGAQRPIPRPPVSPSIPIPAPPTLPPLMPPSVPTPAPRATPPEPSSVTAPRGMVNDTGSIRFDLPYRVTLRQPFTIDVWLAPRAGAGDAPAATVFMERTEDVVYQPREFVAAPGERIAVSTTIVRSESGLAQVLASADGWGESAATVDAGITFRLEPDLPDVIRAYEARPVVASFKSPLGAPVHLDAGATASFTAIGGTLLDLADGIWKAQVRVQVTPGASSIPAVTFRSPSVFPGAGQLTTQLLINDQKIVWQDDPSFAIAAAWWIQLAMCLVGGLLYGCVRWFVGVDTGPRGSGSKFGMRVVFGSAIAASVLAYIFASTGVLGVALDDTSLRGFVALGLGAAAVGIEPLLNLIRNRFRDTPPQPEAV